MPFDPIRNGSFSTRQTVSGFMQMRAQMDDLQRQMATGQRAETGGGLGIDRRISLDLRGRLSSIEGHQETIKHAETRIQVMTLSLETFVKASSDLRGAVRVGAFQPDADGRVTAQVLAEDKLKLGIDVLNQSIGGRYLFSGRSHDVRPVVDYNTMINGDGAGRAGIKTMIAERADADRGAAGLGRVTVATAGATTTISETMTPQVYGYRLIAASSSAAGIAAAPPAGAPAAASFTVAGLVNNGDKVSLTVELPDGTQRQVELTASTTGATVGNIFNIAGLPASLGTAVTNALTTMTQIEMPGASAIRASMDFFAGSTGTPPVRVPPPALTATTTVAGTAADTVIWYQGDDDASIQARATAPTSIDDRQTVNLGARANEQAFRVGLAQFAAMAATTYAPTDTLAQAKFESMADKVKGNLNYSGVQSPEQIAVEVGLGANALNIAKDRHTQMKNYLTSVVSDVEQVSNEQVAAQLLTLQTRMQASYQTTSILSRLSLTEYLR
jgi:flagellin-like hook-associated protein FlgL